jgi:hypothetical protein
MLTPATPALALAAFTGAVVSRRMESNGTLDRKERRLKKRTLNAIYPRIHKALRFDSPEQYSSLICLRSVPSPLDCILFDTFQSSPTSQPRTKSHTHALHVDTALIQSFKALNILSSKTKQTHPTVSAPVQPSPTSSLMSLRATTTITTTTTSYLLDSSPVYKCFDTDLLINNLGTVRRKHRHLSSSRR